MTREQQSTDVGHPTSEEKPYFCFDSKRHRAGILSMVQYLFERAKTDPDCLSAAAELGWGPEIFDEMKKHPPVDA